MSKINDCDFFELLSFWTVCYVVLVRRIGIMERLLNDNKINI